MNTGVMSEISDSTGNGQLHRSKRALMVSIVCGGEEILLQASLVTGFLKLVRRVGSSLNRRAATDMMVQKRNGDLS